MSERIQESQAIGIRHYAEELLLSHCTPPAIVVNNDGVILYIHGRTRDFLLSATTSAYNTSLFAVIQDELRKPVFDAFHHSVENQTIASTPWQFFPNTVHSPFIFIAIRPFTSTSNKLFFLITFENAANQVSAEEAERRITHALQQSEQRYKQLVQAITDYIYTVSIENNRAIQTSHSPNCVAVTGYTSSEYQTTPLLWIDMVHPDDRDFVIEQANKVIIHQIGSTFEHRIIHKDGSVRWVRNTTVLHKNEQGELIGYDGLVSNITDLKETELHLRESEELFRFILEQSPLGVTLSNSANRIVKANHVFCSMLEYSELELKKLTIAEITHPEDLAKEAEFMIALQTGSITVARVEKRYITKSSAIIWVNLHSSYIRDTKGNPVFTLGIAENISARKQAEEALRSSEARLSALLQNSNDAVVITDKHGVFTYASPSIARLFYYSPANLIGREAFEYIHPEDRDAARAIYSSLTELPLNAMKTYRYRYRRADGSWAHVESVSTNLLKHPLILGVVSNTRDISNRYEPESDNHDSDDDE